MLLAPSAGGPLRFDSSCVFIGDDVLGAFDRTHFGVVACARRRRLARLPTQTVANVRNSRGEEAARREMGYTRERLQGVPRLSPRILILMTTVCVHTHTYARTHPHTPGGVAEGEIPRWAIIGNNH